MLLTEEKDATYIPPKTTVAVAIGLASVLRGGEDPIGVHWPKDLNTNGVTASNAYGDDVESPVDHGNKTKFPGKSKALANDGKSSSDEANGNICSVTRCNADEWNSDRSNRKASGTKKDEHARIPDFKGLHDAV